METNVVDRPATLGTGATLITEDAATETATLAGAQASVDRARQYVVLALDKDADKAGDTVWTQIGSFDGNTGDEAIRKAVTVFIKDGLEITGPETYVAIPARSFQPVELTAKAETKIEFRGR